MGGILAEATAQFRLSEAMNDHGPWHWEKVERNVLALSRLVKKADKLVCRLFAILHDSRRENETEDPEHGQRAADYCRSLGVEKLNVTDLQLEILCEACADHEKGLVSPDPTIGVCWDADRLDLSRDGILPDPELLSTDPAKGLIWRI